MKIEKEYIGDGVYVYFDGYQIWLETQRSDGEPDRIALEYGVYCNLVRFARKFYEVKNGNG